MTDEPAHKPHGIVWYAAWIVMAMVLYPLSLGPVVWLAAKANGNPECVWDVANVLCMPIWMATDPKRELVGHEPSIAFRNYREWWAARGLQ